MSLSQLAAECRACPYAENCDHKRMEALAYIDPVALGIDMAASASDGLVINIDIGNIEDQINRLREYDLSDAIRRARCHFNRKKDGL